MNNRDDALGALEENPGLKPLLDEIHASALDDARKKAARETNIAKAVFDKIEISRFGGGVRGNGCAQGRRELAGPHFPHPHDPIRTGRGKKVAVEAGVEVVDRRRRLQREELLAGCRVPQLQLGRLDF